jgi:cytochrome c biogenesis protein CcmG/thiol:disulfide interchange protein DsbE
MKRTLVMLAFAVILAGAAVYQYVSGGEGRPAASAGADSGEGETAASAEVKPKPGYTAPTLNLPDLNDKQVTVGGKRDKLLIVNFWASWCGPCEVEAPDLNTLAKEYAGKVELLGINATNYDKERQARQFVVDQKLAFPILMDREGTATDLYKVNSFPTSLIIDGSGIVRERIPGVIPKSQWKALIDKWLQQEQQAASG